MTRAIVPIFLLSMWALAGPNLATAPPNLERTLIAQQERVSSDPRDPVAWNDLGNLLVLADRDAEAEEAYRQALDLAPDNLPARFNLGLLLQQTGRQHDAESELERLLELDPHHAWGHYQLGIILAAQEERRSALEHYARALAYDPSLAFAHNNPHIIDNPLFSEALLLSQRYSEPAGARVPRQYGEPDRIVELMLRHQEEAEGDEEGTGEAESGEEGETAPETGGGSSASFEAAPAADPARPQPGSVADQMRPAAAPQQTGGAVVVTPPPARGQRPGSTASRPTPRAAPAPGSPTAGSPAAGSPAAGSPAASGAPEASSQDRPALREAPPPPPSRRSSRYIPPSRRSTGQLEFKLLPEEEPPIRVARANDSKSGS